MHGEIATPVTHNKHTKGQEKTFGSEGYIYYFECDDGFIGIYICPNVSNSIF